MDYEQLLRKYIEHVRQSEGSDFLDRLNASYGSDVYFSKEEVGSLESLSSRPPEETLITLVSGDLEPVTRDQLIQGGNVAHFAECRVCSPEGQMVWRDDSPDWTDAGKAVDLLSSSGSVLSGVLEVGDFFPDGKGDEIPVWNVRAPDGESSSLYDFDGWRFAR